MIDKLCVCGHAWRDHLHQDPGDHICRICGRCGGFTSGEGRPEAEPQYQVCCEREVEGETDIARGAVMELRTACEKLVEMVGEGCEGEHYIVAVRAER